MRRKWIIAVLVAWLSIGFAHAQDAHFSQFYAAPNFMSPSLTGASGGTRFVSNYRNQWPGISSAYKTFAFSTDTYINRFKSGLGLLLVTDEAGSAHLRTSYVGFQYSYRVQTGRYWQFVPALQLTLGQKSLDRSLLEFPDELVTGGNSGGDALLSDTKAGYLDFTVSAFVYSREAWLGVVVDHLLKPDYSFLGEATEIPMKFTVFGGFNLWRERARRREEPRRASLVYRYERQTNFNQLDLGAYVYNKILDFGLWYRGIPVFDKDETGSLLNNDAVVFLVGITTGSFRFGYSYDIQISDLASHGAGAHEISLSFEMGELFGCGTKYLDCFTKRAGHRFNKKQPRNLRIY